MSLPSAWKPADLPQLRTELGKSDWVLCGGHSVDLLVGRRTREHGDIDVGIFRADAVRLLSPLGRQRVFLCSAGSHVPWDGGEVPAAVHDIWVTSPDREFWSFQVMLYDAEGTDVIYRRDPRVRWPRAHHAITVGGVAMLNPAVTLLYKLQSSDFRDKDRQDFQTLTRYLADHLTVCES